MVVGRLAKRAERPIILTPAPVCERRQAGRANAVLRQYADAAEDARARYLLHGPFSRHTPLAPIPEEILDQFIRQGPLTPEEWVLMREHPVIGERILSPLPGLTDVAKAVTNSGASEATASSPAPTGSAATDATVAPPTPPVDRAAPIMLVRARVGNRRRAGAGCPTRRIHLSG